MSQTLPFDSIAKGIIKETISNALFIDDNALEPFRTLRLEQNMSDLNCFMMILNPRIAFYILLNLAKVVGKGMRTSI